MDDLNDRAARLMGWKRVDIEREEGERPAYYWDDGQSARHPTFTTDPNQAAELFRAAPEFVQWCMKGKRHGPELWLDPAALTRAVVEAWEGHSAKGGDDGECVQLWLPAL